VRPCHPRDVDQPTSTLTQTITTLPEQLRRSLTWDRGKELSAHAQFSIASGVKVYFADPKSPWQRGTNENTNGLLRQYFPKGTDLSRWNADEIAAIAHTLNTRARKADAATSTSHRSDCDHRVHMSIGTFHSSG
jgi:IS30 family transposase